MVRERVKNRNFTDRYLIPPPPEGEMLPLDRWDLAGKPLEIDIGCGRGRFLLARARNHPRIQFLGIDRSLLRLRKIDRNAVSAGLTNIRLLMAEAGALLAALPHSSVQAFYVFFPDPWPKRRHHPRRLVAPPFARHIIAALQPGGTIHLCTDFAEYYQVMCKTMDDQGALEQVAPYEPAPGEETDFELIFRAQGHQPFRCSYRKRCP